MSEVEIKFEGRPDHRTDDVQALRSLLEEFEGLLKRARDPRWTSDCDYTDQRRTDLAVRINAYSALVFAKVTDTLDPRVYGRRVPVPPDPHHPGCAALRNPDRLCDCKGVHSRSCALFTGRRCDCKARA